MWVLNTCVFASASENGALMSGQEKLGASLCGAPAMHQK